MVLFNPVKTIVIVSLTETVGGILDLNNDNQDHNCKYDNDLNGYIEHSGKTTKNEHNNIQSM